MKQLVFLYFLLLNACLVHGQSAAPDTFKKSADVRKADDPANFLTRVEFFNELQHYNHDVFINQTVLRTNIQIGKKFTTRLDLPLVYNSIKTGANHQQTGIGDISFRLLGYKFFEKKLSAFTASMEVQLNTAASPVLGSGKNLLIPVLSYSKLIPKKKLLLSVVLQQANSVSGDKKRASISFSKLQLILIKTWSPKFWTVVAPEWFVDYVHGGLSMNLRTRMTYAPARRINIWVTPSAGIFGNFIGRYQWSADIGARYFLFSGTILKKKGG